MKPHSSCDFSAILQRNRLAVARGISLIENDRSGAAELHAQLLPHCGHAQVIGITGAPGAGKSTLINALLQELLQRGRRIAVVAVDPSSPISGGAILGDRVRMADHGANDSIFIRSVSSRGHLGGLSRTTGKIIDLFDAAGYDTVIVETVGTGQSEVEISNHADTRIVVCPPGLGDEIQAIKAGILEIADILVVNKGDLPLAQRTQLDLQVMRQLRHPDAHGWEVPVMRTVATSGEGIGELLDKVAEHAQCAGVGQRLRKADNQHVRSEPLDFGEFTSESAAGVTLAHSLLLSDYKLKKGHVLCADDISKLQEAGVTSVTGARLRPNELSEDAAAASVATLLAGQNVTPRKPYTGRCNLHATRRGVVVIDTAGIERINQIDESITVGTLPPWSVVRSGQVVATVKIIPLGVNQELIGASRSVLDAPPLSVAALIPHRAALILSDLPGTKESAFAHAVASTRQRLDSLGSRLAFEMRCPHRVDTLQSALGQSLAAGCDLILMYCATMTKDRRDTAPSAIVSLGGRIERMGMPVEPGNMLTIASIQNVPVIVLPGCARSQRLNGLDWVLRRLLARLPVNTHDIARMGVGGLIRSAPSDDDEEDSETLLPPLPPPDPTKPCIAVLILAAGQSSRMAGTNKLLEPLEGIPLVLRSINAALASLANSVSLVTGFAAEKVEELVASRDIQLIHNPDYANGMASSLACGLKSLPADVDAAVIMLADMPLLNAAHIDALIEHYVTDPGIVVPLRQGRRGNPVLWPREFFEEICALEGDQGARYLLDRHADQVKHVTIESDAIFADVDTPEMLLALRGRP